MVRENCAEIAVSDPCWTLHAAEGKSQDVPQWEDFALPVNVVSHYGFGQNRRLGEAGRRRIGASQAEGS